MTRVPTFISAGNKPWRSNCLFWAVGQYVRCGGYLAFRKTVRGGWWWHCLWSPDLEDWYEFYPVAPKRRRRVPEVYFRGRVRTWRGSESSIKRIL